MAIKLKYVLEFYGTVAVPLLYAGVLYAVFLGGTILVPTFFRLFGLAISLLGLVVWLVSYLQLGRSFGVLPTVQKKVTTGLYARYKHPMYIGITLTYLGLSLANESIIGLLATILILLPVLVVRAKLEERKLL